MNERDLLAEEFERHRAHLRAVAYRMLGSVSEADDVVQEAWLRLDRSSSDEVENMRGWLTTVVARLCLDELRARRNRRELLDSRLPEPVVTLPGAHDPEHEVLVADAVGLALLVVLEKLTPAERLAFVLHDMFALPYEEIAPIVGRSTVATRQLASRARRRVRASTPNADTDPGRQREVIDAFLAAARDGDFDALVAVLDPEVVFRMDRGRLAARGEPAFVSGAEEVARYALARAPLFARYARPALVNGAAGLVVVPGGHLIGVVAFATVGGRIAEIDLVADPAKLPTSALVE